MNIRIAGAVLAILVGHMATLGGSAGAGPNPSVAQLRWMVGCFEMRSGDRLVEEHRMGVRSGSMLGMARTTTRKGLGEYELTLIQERAGKIVFEARPSGQPAAVFTATSVGPDSVVFAAPEHDYPQVVGYRRVGPDSVIAWISGRSGGKAERRIEFPYVRVSCAEAAREALGEGPTKGAAVDSTAGLAEGSRGRIPGGCS
jgi:hypothetical protein